MSGFLVAAAAYKHPAETDAKDGHADVFAWFWNDSVRVGCVCLIAKRKGIDRYPLWCAITRYVDGNCTICVADIAEKRITRATRR